MSETQQKDPETHSATPNDQDEEIIDLLDEIPKENIKDAAPEVDDGLELIDVEEDETDDEIVWFDDLEKEIGLPKSEAETSLSESALPDKVTKSGQNALLSDGSIPYGSDPALSGAGVAAAATAALHRSFPSPVSDFSPADSDLPPQASPVLSVVEIEAAVERVIERKLGRTIESIIRQAIETAVSKEIERLKRLLLDDDHGTAP